MVLLIFLIFLETSYGNVSKSYAQSLVNWSDLVNLSGSGSASNPLLLIDQDGFFHVLWVDKIDKNYMYVESKDGLSWSSPKNIKFPFKVTDSPPVLVAGTDRLIHVFWRDEKNILYYSKMLRDDFSNPTAWETISLAESVAEFDIVNDNQNILHLTYLRNENSDAAPAGIYYRQSNNNGASWSGAVKLYESQYFRSLAPKDIHIRITVSGEPDAEKVFVAWDNQAQKRVFIAKSIDGGLSWAGAQQIIGPEADPGFSAPFNVEAHAVDNKVLILWQVEKLGARCTQYSQWSTDGGDHWDEPVKILPELTTCPEKMQFIMQDKNLSIFLFSAQGDLALIAWDGARWSRPQIQSKLSALSNPVTYDAILFRCQQMSFYADQLFVVGCDEGSGGDIWFTSRALDSLEKWFPPPSAWSPPTLLTFPSQKISSLSSVVYENNINALWVQSLLSKTSINESNIQYARWDGKQWSKPVSIIQGLNRLPTQLAATVDSQGKLLLTWVDNGDLFFSWADSAVANTPTEWAQLIFLPSPSKLNSSPDILVDASGRIVVVYAVPLNEGRGIYAIQSTNFGETWSQPVKIFDAASANWDLVDQPKISLTGDGRLHILFTRYSALDDKQPMGLYYSRSMDGGNVWSEPMLVSEQSVQWSNIIGYDKQTVHRLWQERDESTISTYHQISRDGGETWDSVIKISSIKGKIIRTTSDIDQAGNLHLIQLVSEDGLVMQDWKSDGSRWMIQEIKDLNMNENDIVSIDAGVTVKGYLDVIVLVALPNLSGELENEILSFDRSLGLSEINQPLSPAVISTTEVAPILTALPNQPTPTEIPPLANLSDTPSQKNRNIVGLILVGGIIILMVIVIAPSYKKQRDQEKKHE